MSNEKKTTNFNQQKLMDNDDPSYNPKMMSNVVFTFK